MIEFIHFSDTHLGLKMTNRSFDYEYAEERRRQIWNTLKETIKYTQDNNIDFVFIPGDLYEYEYFTVADGERLRDIFSINPNTKIIIAAGNHDYLDKDSIYKKITWPENVFIFDDKTNRFDFPEKDLTVFGYSWDKIEIKDEFILDNESYKTGLKYKVLLLHSDVSSSSKYLPVSLNNIKNMDFDYVALGHIHKKTKLAKNIYYSGCLEPTHFNETGKKGFIKGKLDGKLDIKFIPFSKREFNIYSLKIDPEDSYKDIYEKFLSIPSISKDFIRVNLKGYIDPKLDKEMLFEDIKENFYYLEIIDKTLLDYDLTKLKKDYKGKIIGMFIEEMEEKDLSNPIVKDALYIGLQALLKE